MKIRAQIRMLPDNRRLHMHDGPIDLIVEAFGRPADITAAYRAAAQRFATVLDELCGELKFLRQPAHGDGPLPQGSVARRMVAAVAPYAATTFITPMAAVAGAVAEEIVETIVTSADLSRAYVNDGGDVALHLAPNERFVIGMVERPDRPSLYGTTTIEAAGPIRGIATSGWRGRSFSLGIADAVTILADTATMADAAATIVANAVDLPGHSAIVRIPAWELQPDTDLGARLVTQSVGALGSDEIRAALAAGEHVAERLREQDLIRAAALYLQGETRLVGVTDGGLNVLPTFEQKQQIVKNAIEVMRCVGLRRPKLAIMSATEAVSASVPSTEDAHKLTEMAAAGQFGNVDLLGPIALDCALLESAARAKGITHPVAGHADCMVVPNIEAGNLLGKAVKYLGGSQCAHVVVGAKVPILIPSRVESVDDKVNSIALGVLFARR